MHADDDIKIYQLEAEPTPPTGEGERSAASYLHHRDNGNLQKCRELGQLLASTFADDAKRYAADPYRHQKLTLISFVLSDELAGIIFDQLLQKSVMSSFQQLLEAVDNSLAAATTDSTAYTLYILDDRHTSDNQGKSFAELCGQSGDAALIAEGRTLAESYRRLFGDIISSYSFAE